MSNFIGRKYSEEEIKEFAKIMLANKLTLRQTSDKTGVARSSLHKYFTTYLPLIDRDLNSQIYALMKSNIVKGRILGGISTQKIRRGK